MPALHLRKLITTALFFVCLAAPGTLSLGRPVTLQVQGEPPATTQHTPLTPRLIGRIGRGNISNIAYSPDGKLIAAAGSQGIWLYRPDQPNAEPRLLESELIFGSIAFSPDSSLLAVGDAHGVLRLLHVGTGAIVANLSGHSGSVNSVAFSPDGKILACGGEDKTVKLWDVPGGGLIATLTGHTDAVTSVAFSPDGHTLASAGSIYNNDPDNDARLWDVATYSLIRILKGGFAPLAFSPDGLTLASSQNAGKEYEYQIRLWDVNSAGSRIIPLKGFDFGFVGKIAFGRNTQTLIFINGGYDSLNEIDLAHDDETITETTVNVLNDFALSPDKAMLAVSRSDGTFQLLNANTYRTVAMLSYAADAYSMAFSPNGQMLAVADQGVQLWDVVNHKLIAILPNSSDNVSFDTNLSVAFSPDGRTLATGTLNGKVQLWDVISKKLIVDLPPLMEDLNNEPDLYIQSVVFSPNGRLLAAMGTGVHLWEMDTFKPVAMLSPNLQFFAIAFSPDSRTIAVSGFDGIGKAQSLVQIWDIPGRTIQNTYFEDTETRNLAYTSDASMLISGGDGGVYFYDLRDSTRRNAIFKSYSTLFALRSDNRVLAADQCEGNPTNYTFTCGLRFWVLSNGRASVTLYSRTFSYLREDDKPNAIAFSPNGQVFAYTDTNDGTIHLIDTSNFP